MKIVQTMLDHLWTQAHFRSDELPDAKARLLVRDRTVIGTDDTELLEHVFVDVRHHGWSKVIMLQVCNSRRFRSRLGRRFSLEGLENTIVPVDRRCAFQNKTASFHVIEIVT